MPLFFLEDIVSCSFLSKNRFPTHFIFLLSLFLLVSNNVFSQDADEENLSLYQQALSAEKHKQHDKALNLYNKLIEKKLNAQSQTDGLHGLIRVNQTLNRGGDAFNAIKRLEELTASISDSKLLIRNYRTIAIAYQSIGRNEIARDYYAVAVETARTQTDELLLAQLLNEQAYADTLVSDIDNALATFEESKKLYFKHQKKQEFINTTLNQIHAEILSGRKNEAISSLISLKDYFPNSNLPDRTSTQLIRLGFLYRAAHLKFDFTGSYRKKAFQLYMQAKQKSEQTDDLVNQSYANGYIGQLYTDEGRYAEAIIYTRQALEKSEQLNALELQYKWQLQLARVYKASHEIELAKLAYSKVLDILNRTGVKAFITLDKSFMRDVQPVFKEFLDLLLSKAINDIPTVPKKDIRNDHKKSDTIEKLREVLQLTHLLRVYEIESFCRSSCNIVPHEGTLNVVKDKVLIVPFLLQDSLVTLAVIGDDIKYHQVKITSEMFHKKRRYFENNSNQFYQWMVRPFEKYLTGASEIVFIKNSFMDDIPFHTLKINEKEKEKEKYLIEK
ncbi:MAG: hypothetical protein OEX07_05640, partial [Gammaproteobacteria bacterium]|nr:hypothetical protein [Gammaproteobacteria bacterium]